MSTRTTSVEPPPTAQDAELQVVDERAMQEPIATLVRDLRTSIDGLSSREAARRLITVGPNELIRRGTRRWPSELAAQFTHPLALLLALAAGLSVADHSLRLALAIVAVIFINAALAFAQEMQAERAVEALAGYLPRRSRVVRNGSALEVESRDLVPGDLMLVGEGERVSADARLVQGSVELDLSTLTGESQPVARTSTASSPDLPLLEATDLVFSGTTCTSGEARAIVTSTGMSTELGRIAALSARVDRETGPLEQQVKRVALLIGVVALAAGGAFLPLGLAAGLTLGTALSFSIGLIVANVPEGLLPTITLALAVGVRDLAKRGAVVKRLSAVETLGATSVICTDKTGTLTENRMQVVGAWTADGEVTVADSLVATGRLSELARIAALCTTAQTAADGTAIGDPTELALLTFAGLAGVDVDTSRRDQLRQRLISFDPTLARMATIDADDAGALTVHVKGAPETVLPLCTAISTAGGALPISADQRRAIAQQIERWARTGLRVLAIARRAAAGHEQEERADLERDLTLIGLVAMFDPPRAGVLEAVQRAHEAGIRIHVVTGDHALTATEIARRVGIGIDKRKVVTGTELAALSEKQLDALLSGPEEIIFARSSPEAKLRIADALRALGHVVAMTGDGVNDAPALRRADVGIAMGRSGTDVAREAATMVLTDDDFATIVNAIESGRRAYDNVRKFITYIFTHAVPEVVPFLAFALAGGSLPLPLTVMQVLAIDLGTDTLPALALSREPAEPGLMQRPPRRRSERVVTGSMLLRAWGFMGVISATLVMLGFLAVLHSGGWHWGAPTGPGSRLHLTYERATTVAWLGIVMCQVGTAFAARTEHASLRAVGLFRNRALLGGITVALAFAAALVYLPWLHAIFGTTSLPIRDLVIVGPYPLIVWGADEFRRGLVRRHQRTP